MKKLFAVMAMFAISSVAFSCSPVVDTSVSHDIGFEKAISVSDAVPVFTMDILVVDVPQVPFMDYCLFGFAPVGTEFLVLPESNCPTFAERMCTYRMKHEPVITIHDYGLCANTVPLKNILIEVDAGPNWRL